MNPLSWSALEFEEKERHPDWLWYAGLIFAIGATICFFYGNIFFGIFLIIAGASVVIFAQRKPGLLTITLGEKELSVNDEHIAWERVRQFWIDESGKPDKLLLLVKGTVVPMMSLPLEGVTAMAVRTELAKHAPEVAMRESTGVKIAERLGF
jgi:hypothetical protein